MSFFVIGIAGFMGSGKSTLARKWAEYFAGEYIDVDAFARNIMLTNSNVISLVNDAFPVVVNGAIDFELLAQQVFSDSEKLEKLNACVHPTLIQELNCYVRDCVVSKNVFVDAALLTLWEENVFTDYKIWIDASENTRVERFVNRTGIEKKTAQERVGRQMETVPQPDNSWSVISNESALEIAVKTGIEQLTKILV